MKTLLGLLKSKTFWFNAVSLAVVLLEAFGQTTIIKDSPDVAILLTAITNILLRIVTVQPLSRK